MKREAPEGQAPFKRFTLYASRFTHSLRHIPNEQRTVAAGGDVNRDGHPDFIVGAPSYVMIDNDGVPTLGRASIFFGGPSVDAVPDLMIMNPYSQAADNRPYFGETVTSVGDVNGDGSDDAFLGYGAFGEGWLYWGGAGLDSLPDRIVTEPRFVMGSQAATGVGDFDGDGFDDFVLPIAFRTENGWRSPPGRSLLYFGSNGPPSEPLRTWELRGDTAPINAETVWTTKGPGAPSAADLRRRPQVLDEMGVRRQLVSPGFALTRAIPSSHLILPRLALLARVYGLCLRGFGSGALGQ